MSAISYTPMIDSHAVCNLLVADLSTAELWEIDPLIPSSAHLIHHFDGAEDADGITELSPDIYAVIASNSIYTIDLRDENTPKSSAITDSQLGLIWCLDIRTGQYSVIHPDETMAANPDMGLLLGVNGLKITDDYMYYANSSKRIFCRVRIDMHTGGALGPYERHRRIAIGETKLPINGTSTRGSKVMALSVEF
ncbi:hypothetical protein N7465_002692 [Penicillium sp. CMV-2018d]|nr:hypothetical protein N7465_002692 [Penicillium sp. CMV-2018d]